MIAGYIKYFTRWMNGWIYALVALTATTFKSVVIIIAQYTIGLMLTLAGHDEESAKVFTYLESVSEFTYAAIMMQICAMVFFTWYYMNSTLDPIIKIKTVSPELCKLQNYEIELSELKLRSGKESKIVKEIKKQYEEELTKNKMATQDNKGLKEKVKQNDADKKKIEKLQNSIKERDNDIEIKACNLDKLQSTLQSSRDDVDKTKNEVRELELKYEDAVKELDVKTSNICDMELAGNKLTTKLSDKNTEIKEKEESIDDLNNQVILLELQIKDLEESLDEEKRTSEKIKGEKEALEKTTENISKMSESTETEDGETRTTEQIKAENLAKLTDEKKIKEDLHLTREELSSTKVQAEVFMKRNAELQIQYDDLNGKIHLVCEKTEKLKNSVERKDIEIATITKFFSDRENELQTTTVTQDEEISKLNKEMSMITDDRKQVNDLRKQIDELRNELDCNEKSFKQQVSTLEEESHANYLKMKTANRECEEHKREKEIYRKKLLESDAKPVKKNPNFDISGSPINASLDISDRSGSPASNKSLEDQASEHNRSTTGSVNSMRPPMPFPPMFRGMPPPFPPRPMGTPPFILPPRPPFSGPPRPYMPVLRQPLNTNGPGVEATPRSNAPTRAVGPTPPRGPINMTPPRFLPNSAPPFLPNASTPYLNGQAYVNTSIDNTMSSKESNVKKDSYEKQSKTVL